MTALNNNNCFYLQGASSTLNMIMHARKQATTVQELQVAWRASHSAACCLGAMEGRRGA